jgi:hypothetical protein
MQTAVRIIAILFATPILVLSAFAAASCESLTSTKLPNTTITLATPVAAGEFTLPAAAARGPMPPGANFKNMPAFCRVAATLV